MGEAARAHPTSPPRWRDEGALRAMRAALAARHGLAPGPVDERALGRSVAAARRMMTTGAADPRRLAAAYCAGLLRERPFADGNAALALMALYVTLRLGGYRLAAPEAEAAAIIRDAASGRLGEPELAAWIARAAAPLSSMSHERGTMRHARAAAERQKAIRESDSA